MNMKLISKDDEGTVRFLVKDTTPAFLNTYRRIIINKLPAMAIEEIEIIENSSAIYDEMLAHRLGLLVLKTDSQSYFEKENCKCKNAGCARCTLNLTIDVKGPCHVLGEHVQSKDPSVVPVHPKAVIAKLLEGQNIKLVATAILGTGKNHIKFSPGLMFYQKYPTLNTKNSKKADTIIQSCPICKPKGKVLAHDLCEACLDQLENADLIQTNDKDYLVTIEPWGQLSAKEMVEGIAEVLDKQVSELTKEIKKKIK
jgi:DNA-directed RNA polymerase subunit D